MASLLKYKLKPVKHDITLDYSLNGNLIPWIVWNYCGISKNDRSKSQPFVKIEFREFAKDSISKNPIIKPLLLTALGKLRIGTIWQDKRCIYETIFEEKTFAVNFSEDNWQWNSFRHALENRIQTPYPFEIHPIKYENDKNWYLEFQLNDQGRLVIPCMEFFSRIYGRSQEIKRVLATYPEDYLDSHLFLPLDEPEEHDKWKIRPKLGLTQGDSTFLAHYKYDQLTKNITKNIYAQIEAQYDNLKKPPIFVKVAPWFTGNATLKVRGLSFGNDQSFLALQIIGCSEPEGKPIYLLKDSSPIQCEATNSLEDKNTNSNQTPITKNQIEDLVINSEVDPDLGGANIEVDEPFFEIIGTPREIIRTKKLNENGGTKQSIKPKNNGNVAAQFKISEFSTGEPQGNDKDVGKSNFVAPILISKGILLDMWNAALNLQNDYPELLLSVDWYTQHKGFQKSSPPELIPLLVDSKLNGRTRTTYLSWLSMPNSSRRGMLIMRLTLPDEICYIAEIQRKFWQKNDHEENDQEGNEESFKGLIFQVESHDLDLWVEKLNLFVGQSRGKLDGILNDCPGKASTFKHSKYVNQKYAAEAALYNALSKISPSFIISKSIRS